MTDIAIKYLLSKIIKGGLKCLGEGCDRTVFSTGENTIIKMPRIMDAEYSFNFEELDSIINIEEKRIAILNEGQTKSEVEFYRMFDPKIITQYCAKLIKVEEWHNHYITVWEQLYNYENNPEYFCNFKQDLYNLLYTMEKDERINSHNIKISDLHKNNFGYDYLGNLKFIDLGYWKINIRSKSLLIDYDSIETDETFTSYYD